jgi:NADPH2:quinone reductase
MVIFGAASGERPTVSGLDLMYTNVAVIGYWLSPYFEARPALIGRAMQDLLSYLATGRLKTIVGERFPLAAAAEAHRAIAARRTTGKVVLET